MTISDVDENMAPPENSIPLTASRPRHPDSHWRHNHHSEPNTPTRNARWRSTPAKGGGQPITQLAHMCRYGRVRCATRDPPSRRVICRIALERLEPAQYFDGTGSDGGLASGGRSLRLTPGSAGMGNAGAQPRLGRPPAAAGANRRVGSSPWVMCSRSMSALGSSLSSLSYGSAPVRVGVNRTTGIG